MLDRKLLFNSRLLSVFLPRLLSLWTVPNNKVYCLKNVHIFIRTCSDCFGFRTVFLDICSKNVFGNKRLLLSRGRKKKKPELLKFFLFFKLETPKIRSKTALFLLTAESYRVSYNLLLLKGIRQPMWQRETHNCIQLSVLTLQRISVSLGKGKISRNTLGASHHWGAGPAALGALPEALRKASARRALP